MGTDHIPIIIRKAKPGDIDAIMKIETEQFLHPWKRSSFVNELTHDIAWFYVAERRENERNVVGIIVGYIIFWVYGETMELHNIAVSGTEKRKGIGKQLYGFMMDIAEKEHVEEIFLEVRQSNTEAIAFYETLGFKRVGERKNYYNEPVENALVYCLKPGFKKFATD